MKRSTMTPEEYQSIAATQKRPRTKYRNVPVVVDGIRFASKKEARVWGELKLQLAAGEIVKLDRQVSFPITIHGEHVCSYIADFVAYTKAGIRRVIDAKGIRTREYILKKKLMAITYHIDIEEV